jgi:hypothetical protein
VWRSVGRGLGMMRGEVGQSFIDEGYRLAGQ